MSTDQHDPTATFRREAVGLLRRLEDALLAMEGGDRSPDTVNAAFRALHTVKGSGSMFGFDDLAAFAHHFENAFEKIRTGEIEPNDALVDASLRAVDHIGALLEGDHDRARGDALLSELSAAVGLSAEQAPLPEATAAAVSPAEAEAVQENYRIVFYPNKDALRFGANPVLLFEELAGLGATDVSVLTDRIPPASEIDPASCYLGWRIDLTTSAPRSAIEEVFLFVIDDSELTIERLEMAIANPGDDAAKDSQPKATSSAGAEMVSVASRQLDGFLDQVGELVIVQSRLSLLAAERADPELEAVAEEVERMVANLRDDTLGMRMLPIGILFSKFRRVVRDLSRELGKSVELEILGDGTKVDKSLIDQLNDPLVHLFRNALDHGLESPEERARSGKTEKGRLRIKAEQIAGEIQVTLVDDGKGIPAEKIRSKAIERGLIDETSELSDEDIRNLIFEPGFSTAASVSSVSGRGVGMDVVKKTIEALRGTVEVYSEESVGTAFTLKLPSNMAIIDGFYVSAMGGTFVLPIELIDECHEHDAADIDISSSTQMMSVRGEYVPVASLTGLFGLASEDREDQRVVLLKVKGDRLGVIVDEILGQAQTVVKPLGKIHEGVEGLSGATILSDGRVALLLDGPGLLNLAERRQGERSVARRASA